MMDPSLNILVVDDNRSAADALARLLRKQGDKVETVYDGRSAIEKIGRRDDLNVVLTDLKMAQVDGMQVLRAARSKQPPIETIVFTAFGAVDIAVTAMRLGARDFLTKPVTVEQVNSRLDELRGSDGSSAPMLPFVAQAMSSQDLVQKLQRAASVPSSVWIQGEIGSGREFAARTLHQFGCADGGADFFVQRNFNTTDPWPDSGTVLLPNVDSLSDELQERLYRSLDSVSPDVRLIATARGDGRQQVRAGTLRAELYYGLAVVVIDVPPLRHRREDVVPMFEQGLAAYAARYKLETPMVTPRLSTRLLRHGWPGNVRELLNLAERTVVMGADHDVDDVPYVPTTNEKLPELKPGFSLSKWLEAMERQVLLEAMRQCDGDRNAAGRLLGVERNTLRYKLNKYGLLDT